jgi:ribosomal protein S18 acetylase RimI-like enzyme
LSTIIAATADISAVRDLLRRYAASLPFSLDFQDFDNELASLPGAYAPPDGEILLARRRGEPVGVVALKQLEPGIAEVKRLYVAPEARGAGLGAELLARIVAVARGRGYASVRLDSHRASMAPAIALYRRLGFVEIAPFGGEFAYFELVLG